MLGHKAFNHFSQSSNFETFGTLRNTSDVKKYFSKSNNLERIFSNVDVSNTNTLFDLIEKICPDIILNCVGVIKQIKEAKNPLISIEINSLFPHKIANFIQNSKIRLIHISTDCVFSGEKGNYIESDYPDAKDLYGKTKYLGELVSYSNCITIRTSVIGPELKTKVSLLEWFLSQNSEVKGYVNAIYSGLTTNELILIIEKYIIPVPEKNGLYHVSSHPISKCELLKIVANVYNKKIEIIPSSEYKNDKSLNCDRFVRDFKFVKKSWRQMIKEM